VSLAVGEVLPFLEFFVELSLKLSAGVGSDHLCPNLVVLFLNLHGSGLSLVSMESPAAEELGLGKAPGHPKVPAHLGFQVSRS
jgi:hypothetical protein